MDRQFKIGPITVDPGTRECADLPIAKRPDGSQLGIPLIVVNGIRDGPTLLARGGTHGDEFESVLAIAEVGQWLDPEELNGVFLGVPASNSPACLGHVSRDVSGMRENPIDLRELLSAMPGDPGGTITERIAYAIATELYPKADYALDLHSGGDRGTSVALAGFYDVEGEFGRISYEMARVLPIELMWSCPTITTDEKGPMGGGQFEVAYENGVPLAMAEVTGEGRCRDKDVGIYVTGLKNIMKYLEMIEGEIEGVPEQRRCVGPESFLRAQGGGFLRALVETGQEVSDGEILGQIRDVYGRKVEEIVAPLDGIVTGIRTRPVVWPGETTFLVSTFVVKGAYWP